MSAQLVPDLAFSESKFLNRARPSSSRHQLKNLSSPMTSDSPASPKLSALGTPAQSSGKPTRVVEVSSALKKDASRAEVSKTGSKSPLVSRYFKATKSSTSSSKMSVHMHDVGDAPETSQERIGSPSWPSSKDGEPTGDGSETQLSGGDPQSLDRPIKPPAESSLALAKENHHSNDASSRGSRLHSVQPIQHLNFASPTYLPPTLGAQPYSLGPEHVFSQAWPVKGSGPPLQPLLDAAAEVAQLNSEVLSAAMAVYDDNPSGLEALVRAQQWHDQSMSASMQYLGALAGLADYFESDAEDDGNALDAVSQQLYSDSFASGVSNQGDAGDFAEDLDPIDFLTDEEVYTSQPIYPTLQHYTPSPTQNPHLHDEDELETVWTDASPDESEDWEANDDQEEPFSFQSALKDHWKPHRT